MTPAPPRVIVASAPIATVASKTIFVLTVELWSNQVCVRLAGVPTWRDDPDPHATSSTDDNGVRELGELTIHISDDVGTHYRMTSGQADGTDMEWRADWHFRPGVPGSARRLSIRTTGERPRSVDLSLAA